MTTQALKEKVNRYLHGQSKPAEKKQVQHWLSSINGKLEMSLEDKKMTEEAILSEIKAQTAYPLFFPKAEPWWKKITAFF